MIGLEDRQILVLDIAAACTAGARLRPVSEVAGLNPRILQRWPAGYGHALREGDQRSHAPRPTCMKLPSAAPWISLHAGVHLSVRINCPSDRNQLSLELAVP